MRAAAQLFLASCAPLSHAGSTSNDSCPRRLSAAAKRLLWCVPTTQPPGAIRLHWLVPPAHPPVPLQEELIARLDAEQPRNHIDLQHRVGPDGKRWGKVIEYK